MIEPQILPVAITTFSLESLAVAFKQLHTRSPIRVLDDVGIKENHPLAFSYIILAAGNHIPMDPDSNTNGCLNHTFLSFLVRVDKDVFTDIAMYTDLEVSKLDTEIGVVSGSLRHWKDAIYSGCAGPREFAFRRLFNRFYDHFKAYKLRSLFGSMKKKDLADGTFVLL